jgi:hypothetical protein
MFTAERKKLRIKVISCKVDHSDAAFVYNSFTGNAPPPIIVFIEGTLHISLFV